MNHDFYGLIKEYLRVVNEIWPEFVITENVTILMNVTFFKIEFLDFFKENNYFYDYKTINIADYNLIKIPNKLNTKKTTVFDAIHDLPKINAGEMHVSDNLHVSAKLTNLNIDRITASSEGRTWNEWPKELLLECHKKKSGATYTSVYGQMKKTLYSLH